MNYNVILLINNKFCIKILQEIFIATSSQRDHTINKIVSRGGVHNYLIFSDLGLFSFWQDPSDQ